MSLSFLPYVSYITALRLIHYCPTSHTLLPYVSYISALRLIHFRPTSHTLLRPLICPLPLAQLPTTSPPKLHHFSTTSPPLLQHFSTTSLPHLHHAPLQSQTNCAAHLPVSHSTEAQRTSPQTNYGFTIEDQLAHKHISCGLQRPYLQQIRCFEMLSDSSAVICSKHLESLAFHDQ